MVFISYARAASAVDAEALKARLGDLAFLDTEGIEDGEDFPERLLHSLLDASVVVIFATSGYMERPFCRLELRLALAGGELMLALGEGSAIVLDAMPPDVAVRAWPPADETGRVEALVRKVLAKKLPPIRQRLAAEDARKLAAVFLEESRLPPPEMLPRICSLPPGIAAQSIGARFVGRADVLRQVHRMLSGGHGRAARLTGRITAGDGFGKTRLAVEYMHRYASSYPGGIFWVNADSGAIEQEWWRVLNALDPAVPDLAAMRAQGRDVRRELERALRAIGQAALYVIDNIPEAPPGQAPAGTDDFCPAPDAVTVLATSRQDTREAQVRTIPVDTLARDPAILLLTDNVQGAAALSWAEWGRIAEWVGDLPVALELLNRSLALGAITPRALLARVDARGAPGELDRLSKALHGQVPAHAVRGVTKAFSISVKRLDKTARKVAMLLAQLAPAPIPEEFMDALPDDWKSPAVRAALRSRHFVTGGEDLAFGTMHRLTAEFLRGMAEAGLLERACAALQRVMTPDRCRDPHHWPVMRLCRPHAEVLFEGGAGIDATAPAASHIGEIAGILAYVQGDYAGARRMQERVLEARRRVEGEEHADTLTSMNNLAVTLGSQGDYAGARRIKESVLEVMRRMLGEEHAATLISMNNLAHILWLQGDYGGSRQLQEQVLEVTRRVRGEEHPDTLMSMNNLASILKDQGDLAGARRMHERVLELMTRVQGQEHLDTLTSMGNLACTLRDQGDREGALRLLRQCVAGRHRILGDSHPETMAAGEYLRQWEAELESGESSATSSG